MTTEQSDRGQSRSARPTLLVSLGTSSAIVPEAFLLPGTDFRAVHVITTDKTDVGLVEVWFAERAPGVPLSVTRVEGFVDFISEQDHFRFEEVLYRWILELEVGPEDRFLCLSGGFKTMSASMQKAAAVLGAAEVFHVLCDLAGNQQPKTAVEIEAARAEGHLHWIRLGPESGWPQLRTASATEYPLETVKADGCVRSVRAPDSSFRDRLRGIVE
ncbi:MAG: CRISPR-associated ring nuclease, partial [Desulfobacterales bacterium]|nr:CRISPR-associated ring nuclease [Desulfobacterales bacterium]